MISGMMGSSRIFFNHTGYKFSYTTIVAVLIILFFTTCRLKTFILQDNITKVPIDTSVYKNKVKFDSTLLNVIETDIVYEEYSTERNSLCRTDNHFDTEYFGVYRFYPNGCLNYFVLTRDDIIDTNTFNPQVRGYRGLYYKEKGKIHFDLYAESNELGHIGRLTGTLTVSGDTLYEYVDHQPFN